MSKYSFQKIYHFKDKLDSLPKSTKDIQPPVHIRLKPTNRCNHNCSYCAYRVDNLQLGKDMDVADSIPKEKIAEIIEDMGSMGVKAVTFSGGGEPLCYEYICDAVKMLAANKIKIACITNGALLRGEIAELFAKHATWIRLSIDGYDPQSYAEIRGVSENEFHKVLDNIRNFSSIQDNKCLLGISLIINKDNYRHIYPLVRDLKACGAATVKLSPCVVSNDGAENNRYHADIFEDVKKNIQECIAELADDAFEIYDAYHVLDEKFDKDYDWCPYLQILPVIGADCNVYSCQDKAYNLESGLLGSIKEKSFKDFWNESKNTFFKIKPNCDCNHHCVANSKNQQILDYLNVDCEHLEFV